MIVIIDTNIWLSELGLRSGLGAAVRYFLNKKSTKVALPEVVKLESESKLRKLLTELTSNISSDHRQLLTIFGSLKEVVLPDHAKIEERVSSLFNDLGVGIFEIPFSLESARSSFIKTINKEAPSDKSQQFKDGVLWADCISLLDNDDVYLITSDKAFYEKRDYKNGLAENLMNELKDKPKSLTILPDLVSLLEEIKEETTLDEEKIFSEFVARNSKTLNNILDSHGFSLGIRTQATQRVFATENPNILFFEFEFKYECNDERNENRSDAIITLKGDGSYNIEESQIVELRNFGESLEYRIEGEEDKKIANQVIMVGSAVIGHRTVSHSVRYPLNEE
jgi:hypothetical protein